MARTSIPALSFIWLSECPVCGSLLLETAQDMHAEWHIERGEATENEAILYTHIAKVPRDYLE